MSSRPDMPEYERDWNNTRIEIDKLLKKKTIADSIAAYKLFQDYHERSKNAVHKETGRDWAELEYNGPGPGVNSRYHEFFHGEGYRFEKKDPYPRHERGQGGYYDEGADAAYEREAESYNKALQAVKSNLPGRYETYFKESFEKLFDQSNKETMMKGLDEPAKEILATEMGKIQEEREKQQKAEELKRAAQEAKEREQKAQEKKLEEARKTLAEKDNPAMKLALASAIDILGNVIVKQQLDVSKQGIFSFSSTGSQLKANKALLEKLEKCFSGQDAKYNGKTIQGKLEHLQELFQTRGRTGGERTREAMMECLREMQTVHNKIVRPAVETVARQPRHRGF